MIRQICSTIAKSGLLIFLSTIYISCIQEENISIATIETSQVSLITNASATCGGIVIADGGSNVIAQGICWSTSSNPSINNDTTIAPHGSSTFTSSISGLVPGTTYFIRAYATNKRGTAYGKNVTFTTKTLSITTSDLPIISITANSAICGGFIHSDGDSSILTVMVRGICWGTFPSPTIENCKTTDGSGGGSYTSKMDSLTANTTYFVRAYATNNNVTIYGNELSFKTLNGIIGLSSGAISQISEYTATSGGTISSDGGGAVIKRGICWSTSPVPTIENQKTINGSGTGSFKAHLSGLAPNTTYFIRAYAINSAGITYGNEVGFNTKSENLVTDIDGNTYKTISIGSQIWMIENLKTTRYRNGESIGTTIAPNKDISNENSPLYQWAYNGDERNVPKYGRLYTWFAVNDSRNIAPSGWHVASEVEWNTLNNYLISNGYNYYYSENFLVSETAKSLASTTDWKASIYNSAIGKDLSNNNTSGFSAMPGGFRDLDIGKGIGVFGYVESIGFWWTSTPSKSYDQLALIRSLSYDQSNLNSEEQVKKLGLSVRCVKD